MNCYLPWNLKDMTNISAEKLQKNISRQTSYIEMYRAELMKESLKFNIASLLRHVCMNRTVFGSDDFSKKATDCLIVFLHATSFLKSAYFTPTDVENPGVPKCCRNLHRLMMENVKATMRYIDYNVLLRYAMGDVTITGMHNLREKLHSEVFPEDDMFDVCSRECINDDFYRIVDQETGKATGFIDFDVQRNTSFDNAFCLMFSKMMRQDEELPESEYGVIGASMQALDKPFIRYGNSFYSFVTSYSFKNISAVLENYIVDEEETTDTSSEAAVEDVFVASEPVVKVESEPIAPQEQGMEMKATDFEIEETECEETIPEDEDVEENSTNENQESESEESVCQETAVDEQELQEPEDQVQEIDMEPSVDTTTPFVEPQTANPLAAEDDEEIITADEIYDSEAEEEIQVENQEPTLMHEKTEDSIYSHHEVEDDDYEELIPQQEQVPEQQNASEPVVSEPEEPETEPVAEEEADTENKASISENIKEFVERHNPHQIIIPNQIQPSDRMDDLFDDDDFEEIFTEEQENLDNDSAYIETDEYEYPDEFEEDDSNSQEELERIAGDVYELAEEDQMDNPEDESSQEVDEGTEVSEETEKEYSALVSDDTYRYLDEADPSEFEKDEMLEEQEILEDLDEYEDELPEQSNPVEEEDDPYSGESLFSLADDEEEPAVAPEETAEPETTDEPDMSFPPAEEVPDPEPVEATEDKAEEPEQEDTPVEEPEEEPAAEPAEEPDLATEESEPEVAVEESQPKTEPEAESAPAEPEFEAKPETTPVEEAAPVEPEAEPEPAAPIQDELVPEEQAEEISQEPEPAPAEPDVLPLLEHILKFSPSRNNPITIYLMGCQFQKQKELVNVIERARKSWLIDGKDKMFAIPETEISVAIFSATQDPMVNIQRRENIGAVMYSQHKDSWNSLELSFDTSGQMIKADYNRVSRMSFSDWEWRIVEKLGNRILERKGK